MGRVAVFQTHTMVFVFYKELTALLLSLCAGTHIVIYFFLTFNLTICILLTTTQVSAFSISGAMKPFAARGVLPQMWKATSNRKLSVEATISKDALASLDSAFEIHPRRFHKATKQIATLGPSCDTFEMIEKIFLSGADVFRLNFSHGEHHEKEALIRLIREVEKKYNHPIAVLADLQVGEHSLSFSNVECCII